MSAAALIIVLLIWVVAMLAWASNFGATRLGKDNN
jgi:hypothetical protein